LIGKALEIKQIESVYWVHKLGTFSAAAQYLNTTQPNISGRIQALERELGLPVFDRSNRQARLTATGHLILKEAERIMDAMRELRRFAAGNVGAGGSVRVGMTNTVAQTWMPLLVDRLNERHEGIDFDFTVDAYSSLKGQFEDHGIDILICTEQVSASEMITVSKFLCRTSFDWVASTNIDFGREALSPDDLLRHRLITYPRGTRVHGFVMDFFKPTGTLPSRVSRTNSLAAMMQMAASGIGVCTMPGAAIDARYSDRLRVLRVDPPLPPIDFYVTYMPDPLCDLAQRAGQTIVDAGREMIGHQSV
jgi:DNA-binding transcriptional LysR family regulator